MGVILVKLASVLGLSLASGINLYATVAVVGLVKRFELIDGLPAEFDTFDNDLVIGLALLLYTCEFLADKIPAFDSVWDAVHTAIRPFGAALIAITVVGDADPVLEVCAGMLGASLGLATHAAKTGTRWVVNTSPEPLSNVGVSLGEDVAVAGMTVLTLAHPWVSLALSLTLLVLLVRYGPGLGRATFLLLRAVRARFATVFTSAASRRSADPLLSEASSEQLDSAVGSEPIRLLLPAHARKLPHHGRNRSGYLAMTDRHLVFVYRRRFRSHALRWEASQLGAPLLRRGLLLDRLRLQHCDGPLDFVFVKSHRDDAGRLESRLAGARAAAPESGHGRTGRTPERRVS